ncbi:MAG: FtsX-like permease family protein [Candidatus Latescibacterota bacterium]
MAGTAAELGLRSLARNRWRSGLTLAGVAVAVALMVWTLALYEGWIREMVRGATAVETAQVQVHTAGYVDNPRVYAGFPLDQELLERVERVPQVVAVSPRLELYGLVGNEERAQVARILGVDPQLERRATPVADGLVAGRWLAQSPPPYPAPREVVLGSGVAQQLQVGPGAELVAFLEAADGSLGNELLGVVGVVRTANTAVDRMAVFMHLRDAQVLGALEGQVHELVIRTADLSLARQTAAAVADSLGALAGAPARADTVDEEALVVQPWQELLPAVDQMILLFRRSYWLLYLLIYVVAAVGVLNTQRMSAVERRREFGVMLAIGMRPRRMLWTLVVETLVLGLAGAALGGAAGALLAYHHARAGFDMGLFTDQASFSYMGVAFSERLYFVLTPRAVLEPVGVMLGVAGLSALWPAVKAARIDPAPTIAGRA